MKQATLPEACQTCPVTQNDTLKRQGLDPQEWDFLVALAGNPNTGKSTVFNSLTGLRQHTGNWPGKTVARSEGGFEFDGERYKLVDLPGTYSLMSFSKDEEIARDFILFGQPDVTVIVVDASRLERNLNLALQILEITDKAVICLNLIDEARRKGIEIDTTKLARELGVPVVASVANRGEGIPGLLEAIRDVANGTLTCQPYRIHHFTPDLQSAVDTLTETVAEEYPALPNPRWIALRLLDNDQNLQSSLQSGQLANDFALLNVGKENNGAPPHSENLSLSLAESLRWEIEGNVHQSIVEAIYSDAAAIRDRTVTKREKRSGFDFDISLDRLLTHRLWAFPFMVLLFALVFWITIEGANVPSRWIYSLLIGTIYPFLHEAAAWLGLPWWLSGLLIDGMYLSTAWVVSVMLPPMAIFFPLFTLLEDFGYLPRVSFNLDSFFKRVGASGKQSLSMMMGFGCNAAGVISTRIIQSPRERTLAILTNNFALCNGRWPTQILLAVLFIGILVPPALAGAVSALAVLAVALLGVVLTFVISLVLTRTTLKGEVSTFSLELPPYRRPRILQTLYTSLIDRTIFVLWRAVIFALPAGAVIWLIANVQIGGASIAEYLVNALNPLGLLLGLNGIILVAYIVAVPANEIVMPTVLMLTVLLAGVTGSGTEAGVIFELDSPADTLAILTAGGWTILTAINVMLFSLIHNPCSTTLYTIRKETGSRKWTLMAALMPLALGLFVTFSVTKVWNLIAGLG